MYKLEYDTNKVAEIRELIDFDNKTKEEQEEYDSLETPKKDLKHRGYQKFDLSEPDDAGIITVTVYDEKMRVHFPFPEHYWPCPHSESQV